LNPDRLALDGGSPVRDSLLPYGRHSVTDDDVAAVEAALRSDWLTTGPRVAEFEDVLAAATGASHAVAISNGTAALHALMAGIGIGPGDEVVVPVITFAATANAVLYCGGKPVFADVDPETLLMDPDSVAAAISDRTRAVIAVDYAGQPADYDALREDRKSVV
jgi:perosamine synthetase